MANKGVMIEAAIQALNTDSLNKGAVCATDVDAGNLVSLGTETAQGKNVFTVAAPATGNLGGLYVAYPSSEMLAEVNGRLFAGLSEDARDFTNIKGRPFNVFKIKTTDEIDLTIDCVDATGSSAVVGDILEAKANQTLWTRVAGATGATANSTACKIKWVGSTPFPPQKGKIGGSNVKTFGLICIQE